ncbi:uncharacterized protein LOC113874120 [Abrus precatorius]|uniref:Uncharacterized protein LOC113874120 n=1 Tax=Abrus precatorius TaxID=3816 RepID=A0A8B8MJR1_ABRPR|nr:uncharacterized protein LOC113874120 [Abrus precatorius]
MASSTPKTQKRLLDFLNENQEPFILEAYLSEREYYSKRWILRGDSSNSSKKPPTSCLNKKKKAHFPFCKVLKALCNKLAFHRESKNVLTKVNDQRNKHACVPQPNWVNHILQFSSASNSTMFNSCSNIDEEGTSIVSHKDQHLVYSHTLCNMGLQRNSRRKRQRSIKGSPKALGKIPLRRVPNVNENVGVMQQRIKSCGVILPKKITEESLLSAAIWSSLLGQSMKKGRTKELKELIPGTNDVSQILKSKRVLHRIKKMLFDCVKDIAITLPKEGDRKKGYTQFMGPLDLGRLVRRRPGDGANLTYLFTVDYLNSIMDWSNFEPHVKDISAEITDAILDNINSEIVLEMIGTLTPNI